MTSPKTTTDEVAPEEDASVERAVRVATRAASDAILGVYQEYDPEGDEDWEVLRKADDSPLTQADLVSQEILARTLDGLLEGVPVVSEENETPGGARTVWLVDPLDGTKEFLKKNGQFTVNVALVHDGHPVFGLVRVPATGETYAGWTGHGATRTDSDGKQPIHVAKAADEHLRAVVSRSHLDERTTAFLAALEADGYTVERVSTGSSLKFCLLAEGRADLYPRFAPTMEWDTAAGHAVLEAAGGTVERLDGSPLTYTGTRRRNPWFVAAGQVEGDWRRRLPKEEAEA